MVEYYYDDSSDDDDDDNEYDGEETGNGQRLYTFSPLRNK